MIVTSNHLVAGVEDPARAKCWPVGNLDRIVSDPAFGFHANAFAFVAEVAVVD